MVIIGTFMGGIEIDIKKPAIRLPRARRKIGLINFVLFSLIGDIGRNRGFDSNTKKMIRAL